MEIDTERHNIVMIFKIYFCYFKTQQLKNI